MFNIRTAPLTAISLALVYIIHAQSGAVRPTFEAGFRQMAYKLHEQGTELFVNSVLKRMSPHRSLDYRIARETLAEIRREILVNQQDRGGAFIAEHLSSRATSESKPGKEDLQ